MAAAIPRFTTLAPIVRGDIWPGFTATFTRTGFDFTGCSALVHLRVSPDADLLAAPTPAVSYPALGQMTVTVSSEGAVTALFPIGTVYGDVELSRTSPAFGPKTWFRFQFEVVGDFSHG